MRKILLSITVMCLTLFAQAQFPNMPDDPVLDNAHVLTASEISTLNAKIKAFEEETSMHIKVITIDDVSKDYLTVSDYTKALYQHWQLGDPNKHNGLMLVFGKKIGASSTDMKDYCRIMTGWGTMKILSDDYIINTVKHKLLMPYLPDRPAQGFNLALDAMFQTIRVWNKDHPRDMTAQVTTGAGTGGTFATTSDEKPFDWDNFWESCKWWIIGTIIVVGIIIFLIIVSNSDSSDNHYSSSSRGSSSRSSSSSYTSSGCSTTVAIFSCSSTSSSSSSSTSSCSGGGSSCGGGGGGCGGGCGGGGCGG